MDVLANRKETTKSIISKQKISNKNVYTSKQNCKIL